MTFGSRRPRAVTPPRRDTHLTHAQSPLRPGIATDTPSSMPRAEDDVATRARSPEFHDRPGSGKHVEDRMTYF